MKPRTIRYVLGRHDTFKVHNNCDPIHYITSQGMRAVPSTKARLIEAACDKSFVSFESNGIPVPIVLAPSKNYHVSGIIQELTPELTPVSLTPSLTSSLTPSEEEETISDNLTCVTDSNEEDAENNSSLSHNSSQNLIKQELNDNLDLIEGSVDAAFVDILARPQMPGDGTNMVKDEQPDLQLQVTGSNSNAPSIVSAFSYTGVTFGVDYEESNELALIGRLMSPSTFMKALDLGRTYAKIFLQSAGIQKPQDIPLRIALELVPIIISLLLVDSRYFLDLLHDVNPQSNCQPNQCQSILIALLVRGITNISSAGGARFHHVLLIPPSSEELASRTVKALSSLIYDSITTDRHSNIYLVLKKVYPQSEDLKNSRSATFIAIPADVCQKILKNKELYKTYIHNIPWIVRGIVEVIFLQFYSMHDIRLIKLANSDHSSSLGRLYNVCIFILACLFIRQHSEKQGIGSTANHHTSSLATPSHRSIFLSLGNSLLKQSQSWLRESSIEYRLSAQHVLTPGKLDKYMGEWGAVDLFLRNSLLRLAITHSVSGVKGMFESELNLFIQQSVALTKADTNLTKYYSGRYLELSNSIGCLLGLTQKSLIIESQKVLSIYFGLVSYMGTNAKCGGMLADMINILLKFRHRQDTNDTTKVGEKLGRELAGLYERIRKPLMDRKAITEIKLRKKTSNSSPPIFVCFLLIFILHIMLRTNSVVNDSIHVFLYSWNDAALLLYPIAIYQFVSRYYGGRLVRLKVSQPSNLSYLMALYNDIFAHLENSTEVEPGIKKVTDTSSRLLTISIEEASENPILVDAVDRSSGQDELKICVHKNVPNQHDFQCASLITSVPCQFAISEQLIAYCNAPSALNF